jgi:N-acetylmuramoyl-L-alanine amidase
MKPLLIIIDAGHGGMVDGKYTTAPSKMHTYPSGEVAYEGVINRRVKDKLMGLMLKEGIAFVDITPGELDFPLSTRTQQANDIYALHSEKNNCLYLSIHSNAGGGTGFEVWTTPGQTKSDKYADIWAQELKKAFPEFPLRVDRSDGDLDKESNFWVLMQTHMPAVLGELLFFDNAIDYKMQNSVEYYNRVAQATLNFLKRSQTEVL